VIIRLPGSSATDMPNLIGKVATLNPRNANSDCPTADHTGCSSSRHNRPRRRTRTHVWRPQAHSFKNCAFGTFGTANRRFFHGPGFNNTDFGMSKRTVIKENYAFDLRVEFSTSSTTHNLRILAGTSPIRTSESSAMRAIRASARSVRSSTGNLWPVTGGGLTRRRARLFSALARNFSASAPLWAMNVDGYLIDCHDHSRRRIVLPLMLSLLFSAPLSAQTAESYRQEALQLSRAKSWDQAALNYRKALALEPNDAVTHLQLGSHAAEIQRRHKTSCGGVPGRVAAQI